MKRPPIPQGLALQCASCGILYANAADAFSVRNRRNCRECLKAYLAAYRTVNKQKLAEMAAAKQRANPERYREKNAKYNRENRERILAQKRTYYATNRDEILRRKAAHDKAHPEIKRAYRHRNPHIGKIGAARRRRVVLNAPGSHTAAHIKQQYDRQRGRCYWCKERVGTKYHVDHVVPLSRGGSDGKENIVIACPGCNRRKRDKMPSEWAGVLL